MAHQATRVPAGTAPTSVHLQVADLERSVRFYREILGLTIQTAAASNATLGAPNGQALVHLTARIGARPVPRRAVLGLYHFALLLPSRAALGRFLAHVARLGLPIGLADHGVSEALYLTDPDGLGIEVYADRSRDTWQYAAGQLVMTAEPLDVNDLVASGGAQVWAGIPSGTVLGHMHLHVGDLAIAESVYGQALGLDVTMRGYPGALFLSAGGYHHHLGVNTWAAGLPPAEDQARLLAWDLRIPSRAAAEDAAQRLSAAGLAVEHAGSDAWVVTDPWQTRLRLVSTADDSDAARAVPSIPVLRPDPGRF
jgi:catechol 2,3-dioxygenase